ncbi:MAG: MFS transporter [Actinomycetia bacterium]|nr:MFS transporter [Actinomycetes bacterium]MCP5034792.1 MFS transporter [Actinomycetes bacterium]
MGFFSGTFAALTHREYRMLWSGSMLATTAFMMSFMLVPSVAFEITGSNAAAGFAQMGSGIAMFIVSPIGGVIADRFRKKALVLTGQAVPAAVILVTGILIVTDRITIPILTGTTLIMGLGFAFMGPARQAWVAELVPATSLPNAIALQQIAQNISQVAGPLFIAILVGTWVGIGGTYLVMASVFVIVLPLTSSLPNTEPGSTQQRSIRAELAAGINYVWSDLKLRTLWLGFVGMVICGFAFQTLLPGLLSQELDHSPSDIGVIFLVLAIAGLVVNLQLAGVVGTQWAWIALLTMGFTMAVGFVLISLAPTYVLAVMAGIPLGIGRSGFMLVDNAILMSSADRAYHGRVMSLAMMGFGSQALLAPVWGAMADWIGVRQTLFVVGIIAAIMTTMIGLSWLRARSIGHRSADTLNTEPTVS